eukprot:Skav232316  [mRNA]  locus=scaffold2697:90357:94749:- [translate_table: standard]
MATTGSERQLPWVFQKASESTTMQMNLINLSMTNSAVFRKMKLEGEADGSAKAKPKAAPVDKKKIADAVKGDLESIGLASTSANKDGNDGDGEEDGVEVEGESGEVQPDGTTDVSQARAAAKKQNLSGQKSTLKSKLWTGFHPDEQKTYQAFVTAIDGSGESRHKTALDEALGCLLFMQSFLGEKDFMASGEQVPQPRRKKARTTKDTNNPDKTEDMLLGTLQFCLGIWMEFCFTGEVTANGKLFKTWSGLRTELQQILMTAHEQFLAPSASESGAGQSQVDPLNLAKLLCNTFASKPVSQIIFDDAEEANIKRVTTVMQLHRHDIVEPLSDFMKNKMHLPLMLLDYPQKTIHALSTTIQTSNIRSAVDLMAFLQTMLQKTLPFSWICFAQDVSDLLTAKGHFVEHTEKAGVGLGSSSNLPPGPCQEDNGPGDGDDDQQGKGFDVDVECVPLPYINDFKEDVGSDAGRFADSAEAKTLDFKKGLFTGCFFKVLQSKLSAALWDFYGRNNAGEKNVVLNIAGKKPEAFLKLPLPDDLRLYFIGNISQIKAKNSLPFTTLFGIPFYIEARADTSQHLDVFVPAWSVKSVAKSDQAFLIQKALSAKLLVWMPAGTTCPSSLCVKVLTEEEVGEVDQTYAKTRYFVADAQIHLLKPLQEINEKIEAEFALQKQRAEKTARTLVESAVKKANKASGKKPGTAASTSTNAALAGLNIELPDEPMARAKALEALMKDCDRLDEVVANAVAKVTKPTRVPVTKLQSSEERGGFRTQMVRDALSAAKEQAGSGSKPVAGKDDEDSSGLIGVQAAMLSAEKNGSLKAKPKKSAVGGKKGGDAKATAAADIKKLGKHLLK